MRIAKTRVQTTFLEHEAKLFRYLQNLCTISAVVSQLWYTTVCRFH